MIICNILHPCENIQGVLIFIFPEMDAVFLFSPSVDGMTCGNKKSGCDVLKGHYLLCYVISGEGISIEHFIK